jgi:hypothetical protein
MVLKYVDHRKIFLPKLKFYPNGVSLPNDKNEIEVIEKEIKNLLNIKNGDKSCFVVKETRRIKEVLEEVNNG